MFVRALRRAYLRDPCGVLPNALWKTLDEVDSCRVSIEGSFSDPDRLEMWDQKRLLVAWNPDGRVIGRIHELTTKVDLALIHERMVEAVDLSCFSTRTAYVRLSRRVDDLTLRRLHDDDCLMEVRMPEEAAEVSSFIASCYDEFRPSTDAVSVWTNRRVYDPRLWIWVRCGEEELPVALGIAECDRSIGELSLEWIQVAPGHRHRGLGGAVVRELLARGRSKGRFATVSGRFRSPAESLYRSCGFEGDDIWWCLRR